MKRSDHAQVVGGKDLRHDVDIATLEAIHSNADTGSCNHHIRDALGSLACMARSDDAVDDRHIGGVTMETCGIHACRMRPLVELGRAPRHQREPVSRLVKAQRQRLAYAARCAGDEGEFGHPVFPMHKNAISAAPAPAFP